MILYGTAKLSVGKKKHVLIRGPVGEIFPMAFKIESVWMVVSEDENGEEGVCAAPLPGPNNLLSAPLIAADEKRLPFIKTWMEKLRLQFPNQTFKLIRLTTREEVE